MEKFDSSFLNELYELLPIPTCVKETKNFTFVYANQAYSNLIGKPKQKYLGKTAFEVYQKENAEKDYLNDLKAIELRKQLKEIFFVRREPLEVFEVNKIPHFNPETGEVDYIIDLLQNVTLQIRADEILRETESKYLKLFEVLPVGILFVRDSDLTVVEVNNACLQILNLEFDKVIYKNLLELPLCNDPERLQSYIQSAKELHTFESYKTSIYLNTGRKIDVLINFVYIKFLEQEPWIVLIISDVSQLNIANQEIMESLKREQEYNMLIKRFVSMVSHELRAPLSGILLTTELLQKYGDTWSKEEKDKYYNRIHSTIQTINKLLENVLTISKFEKDKFPFNPTKSNLKKFISITIDKVLMSLSPRKEVIFNFNLEQDEVYFDEALLEIILNNLLGNAIKYSPFEIPVYVNVEESQSKVLIAVKNYGIPLSPDEIKHLFKPFYRGKNTGSAKGYGLGLSIVQRCLESHRASISVVSNQDEGTTFTIELPKSYDITSQ